MTKFALITLLVIAALMFGNFTVVASTAALVTKLAFGMLSAAAGMMFTFINIFTPNPMIA